MHTHTHVYVCQICGASAADCVGRLVPFAENPGIQLVPAKMFSDGNLIICEGCIRELKRVPFSIIENAGIVPEAMTFDCNCSSGESTSDVPF
jgi:hypothetical protein